MGSNYYPLTYVVSNSGDLIPLRALVDPGSQVSFITNKVIQGLKVKTHSTSTKVFGIGQTFSGTSTKQADLSIQSIVDPSFQMRSTFLTIPHITGTLPEAPHIFVIFNWRTRFIIATVQLIFFLEPIYMGQL